MSSSSSEITKIDQKVSKLNDLKGEVFEEVERKFDTRIDRLERELQENKNELQKNKQISSKCEHLEKEIQENKREVTKLKENNPAPPQQNVEELKQDFLREKCFARRCNLMLMGLEESDNDVDEKEHIATLLQKRLSIPKPAITLSVRMGATKGKAPRPVLITFSNFPQKLSVWYKKSQLNKDQPQKLWLQEDIPKALRADLNALLKVQRKAKSLPEKYPDVKIKDYKIRINGNFYKAGELDRLPQELQPSALATPQSEEAVVFFGRASPLSNHHISEFRIADNVFTCVEHFLAWQKAKLSEDESLAPSTLNMKDPSEHKRVLNSLKDNNTEQWEASVENILKTALCAKFKQNNTLRKFLCDTHPKRLGEASVNQKWGIGMSLTNAEVLEVNKWKKEGNLLGKSLEVIREELLREAN